MIQKLKKTNFQRKKIPIHEELGLGQYRPQTQSDKRKEVRNKELTKREINELLEEVQNGTDE
jgi:hypothetical protein